MLNISNIRENYGVVYTPEKLVNNILDLIPIKYYCNPSLRWLDIGAGNGIFSINLYERLFKNLKSVIKDDEEREKHIIKNMIFMVEILDEHIINLKTLFGNEANIIHDDFLNINSINNINNFDFIIGNPPFNSNGQIKTPTNNKISKKEDGKTVYKDFIVKSLELLKKDGYLNLIIPCLWLKPDKANLYNILTNLTIEKLHCLSTNETQKLFNYTAQTPTCYFLIKNKENKDKENKDKLLRIFDKLENDYIEYNLYNNFPIPTHGINIINKLLKYVNKYGYLKVIKSSTISKNSKISTVKDTSFNYTNIKTCILENNINPKLIYNYSDNELKFNAIPKLILSHKMYGFPFFDISGYYGISTRDNYIITKKYYNMRELEQLNNYLSTKFALFMFSVTNYRMRLLEKYAFELIPDITKIDNFPDLKNLKREKRDEKIANFFGFSQNEINNIENYSKNYNFFIDYN